MLNICLGSLQRVTDKGDYNTTPNLDSEHLDLLKNHENISILDALKCNPEWFKWGSDEDLGRLRWTQKLIEESCESTLRDDLGEVYNKLPAKCQGGVTYFKLMVEQIVNTTDEAVNNMQELLKTASLNDIKGENVRVLVSHMRGAITILGNLNPRRIT